MKVDLLTLTERLSVGGVVFMTGRLGEANVRLEPAGKSPGGRKQWCLRIITPRDPPRPDGNRQAENQQQASWRSERRKADGVEFLGGKD